MDIYQVLVPELRDDPEGVGYAGKTPGEILALIAAKTRPTRATVVSRGSFLAMCAPLVLRLAGKDAAVQQRWTLLMTMLTGGDDTINVARPQIQGLIAQAVADGVMTPDEAAGLANVPGEPTSRAIELGIPAVGDGHIESALKMIGG